MIFICINSILSVSYIKKKTLLTHFDTKELVLKFNIIEFFCTRQTFRHYYEHRVQIYVSKPTLIEGIQLAGHFLSAQSSIQDKCWYYILLNLFKYIITTK